MLRRDFLVITAGALISLPPRTPTQDLKDMYGLIGKITTAPGKREEFIGILLAGTKAMPGCLSYIVARDTIDPEGIWVTEVWDNKDSHAASLSLPSVREAIAKGKPLIAGFSNRVETLPVGGHGLK